MRYDEAAVLNAIADHYGYPILRPKEVPDGTYLYCASEPYRAPMRSYERHAVMYRPYRAVVLADSRIGAAYALHEIIHLVLGEGSMTADELPLLMPFEAVLIEWVARRLGGDVGEEFRRAAFDYQDVTEIETSDPDGARGTNSPSPEAVPTPTRFTILGAMEDIRETTHWAESVAWARDLGLLDAAGAPGRALGDAESRRVHELVGNHLLPREVAVRLGAFSHE